MELVYKKNTLYVYVSDVLNHLSLSKLEDKINSVLGIYEVNNLVIEGIEENADIISNLQNFDKKLAILVDKC